MLIESYRRLPKDLLLALVQFDTGRQFYIDQKAFVVKYYSLTDEQAIWELNDRNGRLLYLYALKTVPAMKAVKRAAERVLKKTSLYFLAALEASRFGKIEQRRIKDDAEIVGRYAVKVDDVFVFVLYKNSRGGLQ